MTRGIPRPSSYVTGWRGNTSYDWTRRVWWNAVSCDAGTPFCQTRLRHSTIPNDYTYTWDTTYWRRDINERGGWTYYAVQTQCRGTYANSGWSGFGAEYVPR